MRSNPIQGRRGPRLTQKPLGGPTRIEHFKIPKILEILIYSTLAIPSGPQWIPLGMIPLGMILPIGHGPHVGALGLMGLQMPVPDLGAILSIGMVAVRPPGMTLGCTGSQGVTGFRRRVCCFSTDW